MSPHREPQADGTDMFAAVSVSRVPSQHNFCCKVYHDVNISRGTHALYCAEGPEEVWDIINQLKALHGWEIGALNGLPAP